MPPADTAHRTSSRGHDEAASEVTPGRRPVMDFAGVDSELIDWSATRRQQIEDVLEGLTYKYGQEHGRLPGEQARHGLGWWAAQDTRRAKTPPKPLGQLRAWWRASAILRFGQEVVKGLLERCRAAGAVIRARVRWSTPRSPPSTSRPSSSRCAAPSPAATSWPKHAGTSWRRCAAAAITHTRLNVVRVHLRAAVYLLDWLTDQDLTLASCRQSDLERWMTRDETRLRREAGHFVRWALAQKIARDLSFPAVKWNGPSQAMDDDARWATARRLLHDDTIRTEDRLAGLLLLLYAQWPAAISRLTTGHIEETAATVRIRFGAVAVVLPGPVAELALQQVSARRSHAVLAQTDSPWLSPGGQPGRPISAWAMGERLRKLGIRLAETRSTALFQLATELPSAILARTLGIHIRWQRAAAGDWAAYAAEVSRRAVEGRSQPG